MAPNQEVIGRFARVGCCNQCGKWLGKKDPVGDIGSANEFDIEISRAIMKLLAWTEKFGGQSHDGRSTLRKLLIVDGVRETLISKCGISPKTYHRRLPQLSVLANLASVSRQPLHRVIVGQLVPWSDRSRSSSHANPVKDRSPRDWMSIELEFEKISSTTDFSNLKNICTKLSISITSARNHFPDLVKQSSRRKNIAKSDKARAKKYSDSIRLRQAFRTLIEGGIYPARPKLAKISGINQRLLERFDDVIDEEWIRVEGKTDFVRIRRSFISGVT
ncbi:hypothetical protein PQQ84_23620 [Paraburkholderia strydomiana]|uniref:hypothetical protein n=1 Tax=Paraburkholderia strydomiana TaxID=1245417 RepID=UPI0038BB1028